MGTEQTERLRAENSQTFLAAFTEEVYIVRGIVGCGFAALGQHKKGGAYAGIVTCAGDGSLQVTGGYDNGEVDALEIFLVGSHLSGLRIGQYVDDFTAIEILAGSVENPLPHPAGLLVGINNSNPAREKEPVQIGVFQLAVLTFCNQASSALTVRDCFRPLNVSGKRFGA